MADQNSPSGEDSESALLNQVNREMSDVEALGTWLKWMPEQVRDAFTTQYNLSLKVSHHLGTMGRLKFDPKTFDLNWEGKQEDLVRLAEDGTLKRLREEVANEGHSAKKRRLRIKPRRTLPGTDDETDDEESGRLEKDFVDGLLQKIRGLIDPAEDWDQLATYLEDDEHPTYHGLKELTETLEEKVFSHVTRVLVPESADRPYTGSFDSFTRVMLLVTGHISSDTFESDKYELEDIVVHFEDRGQEDDIFFRMVGALSQEKIEPDDIEMAMKPWVQKLVGLETVIKQIEVHQSIKDFLDGKGDKA